MKTLLRNSMVVIFLLGITKFASAQISYGPRIGLNFSTIDGFNNEAGLKAGLHIGGYLKLNLIDPFHFNPSCYTL